MIQSLVVGLIVEVEGGQRWEERRLTQADRYLKTHAIPLSSCYSNFQQNVGLAY